MGKQTIAILILILIVGALAFIILRGDESSIPVCRNETRESVKIINYTEVEEYQEPLSWEYTTEPAHNEQLRGLNWVRIGRVSVKNTDTQTGEFTVKQKLERLKKPSLEHEEAKNILAGETLTFIAEFDIEKGDDVIYTNEVIAQSITKTRIVQKQREERFLYNETVCE